MLTPKILLQNRKGKDYHSAKPIIYEEDVNGKKLTITLEGSCGWYNIRYDGGLLGWFRHATKAARDFNKKADGLRKGYTYSIYEEEPA